MFPPEIWTDQTAEQIILNLVKAILLQYLPQEIPYIIKPQMELFHVNEDGRMTFKKLRLLVKVVVFCFLRNDLHSRFSSLSVNTLGSSDCGGE